MENLKSLLDELYRTDPTLPAIEKVAEDNFLSTLQADDHAVFEPGPLTDWSTEDLIAAAQRLDGEKVAEGGVEDVSAEELADEVGGRVMAHAMMDEFRGIKVAMANGVCRVCKEQPRDIEGVSVCSACHE
jgi:hypothetical protein